MCPGEIFFKIVIMENQNDAATKIHILLAGGSASSRSALCLMLAHYLKEVVVEETESLRETARLTAQNCPDLLVLDWDHPVPWGKRGKLTLPVDFAISSLKEVCPCLAVIVISSDPQQIEAARAAGAAAFHCKSDPVDQLLAAIQSALHRQ